MNGHWVLNSCLQRKTWFQCEGVSRGNERGRAVLEQCLPPCAADTACPARLQMGPHALLICQLPLPHPLDIADQSQNPTASAPTSQLAGTIRPAAGSCTSTNRAGSTHLLAVEELDAGGKGPVDLLLGDAVVWVQQGREGGGGGGGHAVHANGPSGGGAPAAAPPLLARALAAVPPRRGGPLTGDVEEADLAGGLEQLVGDLVLPEEGGRGKLGSGGGRICMPAATVPWLPAC